MALGRLRKKLKQYEGKKLDEVENEEDRKILEIIRRLDEEYAFGHLQLHQNVGIALKIENWCKVNYGEKEKWDRKLPSKNSEDEEEKILGSALYALRKNLKKYEGKELDEIENEEDKRILEIVRRLDEEYAFGESQLYHHLGKVLKIENWCKVNYGEKEKWDRKLPSKNSEDEEEKSLGIALEALRARKSKQYEGEELDEVENEEDRKILEIIRRLDEEYAFGHLQLHQNVGIALKIENWCKVNYGDKEKWDRKLPMYNSDNEEEKRLATALANIRKKLKKYEGKELDEIENEEDRKVLEIIRRLDEEYNPRKSRQQALQEAKRQRDEAKSKNSQAKELEQQVSEQLKKRGQNYDEQ